MLAFVLSPVGRKIIGMLVVMAIVFGAFVWTFERGRSYQATIDDVAALKVRLDIERATAAAQLDAERVKAEVLARDLDAAREAEQSSEVEAEGIKANNTRLQGEYDAMVQAANGAPACILGPRADKLRSLK